MLAWDTCSRVQNAWGEGRGTTDSACWEGRYLSADERHGSGEAESGDGEFHVVWFGLVYLGS
jgi:hypothetical protein